MLHLIIPSYQLRGVKGSGGEWTMRNEDYVEWKAEQGHEGHHKLKVVDR